MDKGAEFSKCGKYRYVLWRIWDPSKPIAMCIGLNPSTANADQDDNTIEILMKALHANGYGGLKMTNLYALISPNPKDLVCADPLGNNDQWLLTTAYGCQQIIYCWGAFKRIEARVRKIRDMFPTAKCFGKTANGSPWHPRATTYAGIKPTEIKLIDY